jgi:hypothetical protein
LKQTHATESEPVFAYSTVGAASSVAYRAAARLRAALAAAGFEVDEDFPSLRGDTTTSDEPFVALGRLRPEVALALADLVAAREELAAWETGERARDGRRGPDAADRAAPSSAP